MAPGARPARAPITPSHGPRLRRPRARIAVKPIRRSGRATASGCRPSGRRAAFQARRPRRWCSWSDPAVGACSNADSNEATSSSHGASWAVACPGSSSAASTGPAGEVRRRLEQPRCGPRRSLRAPVGARRGEDARGAGRERGEVVGALARRGVAAAGERAHGAAGAVGQQRVVAHRRRERTLDEPEHEHGVERGAAQCAEGSNEHAVAERCRRSRPRRRARRRPRGGTRRWTPARRGRRAARARRRARARGRTRRARRPATACRRRLVARGTDRAGRRPTSASAVHDAGCPGDGCTAVARSATNASSRRAASP